MALRFASSCSRLPYAELGQEWGAKAEFFESLTVDVGTGRNGMDAIFTGTRGGMGICANLPGAATNEVVAHVAQNYCYGIAQRNNLSFIEANTQHLRTMQNIDGSISLFLLNGGTPIAISQPGIMPSSAYAQFAYHVKVHNTDGFLKLYKNGSGTPVWDTGPLDTQSGGAGYIGAVGMGYDVYGGGIPGGFRFTDVCIVDMVNDGTGFHGVLGDVSVVRHRVVSDAAIQFARGGTDSGTNAGQLDENQINNDTDYCVGATPGLRDLFEMQDITIGNVNILGVQLVAGAKKEGAGLGDLGFMTQAGSGGAELATAGVTTAATYSSIKKLLHIDPATGAAWTSAGWNATRCGYKKTA